MTQMKSLNKALDILELFTDAENDEMRLSEIAKLSGLNKSNVNRIVSVLVKRGYLNQKEKWGKYSIGTKFLTFKLSLKKRLKLRDIALPHLTKLSRDIKESVILAAWDGRLAFYREVINSTHPLNLTPEEGTIVPLHATAIGKIILANKSQQELEYYFLENELIAHTHNTITDIDIMRTHLKKIAQENIAYDDEENFLGARGVASGIKDSSSDILGCVCVFGPSSRLSLMRMTEITPNVKQCAIKISKVFGYDDSKDNGEDKS